MSIDLRDIQLAIAKKIGDIHRGSVYVEWEVKFENGKLVMFREIHKSTPGDLVAEINRDKRS